MPNKVYKVQETAAATVALAQIATTVDRMSHALGVCTSTGWQLIGGEKPEIESITIGRRRLPLVESINQFVERKKAEPHHKVANPPPGEGNRHHRVKRPRQEVSEST